MPVSAPAPPPHREEMMRPLARRSVLLSPLALSLLAGCAPSSQRVVFNDIRFTDKPPLRIDCAAIEIVHDFKPTLQTPNVEHLFPVPPERAMENWARDRL